MCHKEGPKILTRAPTHSIGRGVGVAEGRGLGEKAFGIGLLDGQENGSRRITLR
jgi:hypothetical protein